MEQRDDQRQDVHGGRFRANMEFMNDLVTDARVPCPNVSYTLIGKFEMVRVPVSLQ